uniref:AB hydrolase-1 domain-containing protein n=1 Tax=Bionectria ochroleuca TaxID=29856 RepID=A0A8H7KCK5_BIOOC
MALRIARLAVLAATVKLAVGQFDTTPPKLQTTQWNSTFQFSAEQLALGNITAEYGESVANIVNYDRTQLANGGPFADDFYKLPPNLKAPTKPGEIIKVEEFTNTSAWSIPSGSALSRIIYSTTNLNGTLIPASAFILWPYQAKKFSHGAKQNGSTAPVVLWTHGTSGFYPSGAPSAHRSLFYADFVPFALADAGYVVVAPDYAGLGVGTSWDGKQIPHQYLVREAGANDALNAVRASWKSFSGRVSRDYVVMGHSQGGAVSWGVSEVLARKNSGFEDVAKHHLGTIVVAPAQNTLSFFPEDFLNWVGKDLDQIYKDFKLSDWLTPLGLARTELLKQIEGSQMATTYLLGNGDDIVNPTWNETDAAQWFPKLSNAGNLPFKGPMLVFQGTEDLTGGGYKIAYETVQDTCKTQKGDLEFLAVFGVAHFPVLRAAQQTWLRWIEDRFEGRKVEKSGCGVYSELKSYLPADKLQGLPNSFLQWAGQREWGYELPTAL